MKNFISCLLACAMLATPVVSFAAASSEYDGQPYSKHSVESTDSDGKINLAVIANGDVVFRKNAMYIRGSVYSNGTIMVGNGGGNFVEGLFISGTGNETYTYIHDGSTITLEGYKHIDSVTGDDSTITAYSTTIDTNGAIYDENTAALECTVPSDFDVDTTGFDEAGEATLWGADYGSSMTLTENTHFTKFTGAANCLTIDVSNGDVTVAIDEMIIGSSMPDIQIVGADSGNKAKLYVSDYTSNNGAFWVMLNSTGVHDTDMWNAPSAYGNVTRDNTDDFDAYLETVSEYIDSNIYDPSAVEVYVSHGGEAVSIMGTKSGADMYINAPSVEICGQAVLKGNITTNAEELKITGGATYIEGTVCAPNADTQIVDSSLLIGQLHTDTLTSDGEGKIVYFADSMLKDVEPAQTPEPTETPAPTPGGEEIDLKGLGYAYIFGYEPEIEYVDGKWTAEVRMAPNDVVTREQVAAMLMRMVDQKYDTTDVSYPVTSAIAAHDGTWYVRGLAYLAQNGAFDDVDSVQIGNVTRGEVAKLLVYGLNLSKTEETGFADIADSEYKSYIETVVSYGYMNGTSDDTFEPNRYMTRAEFCQMFNNVIGRTEMGLTAQDGSTVTQETYSIVDIKGHWAEEAMLKATSAYDDNGLIDVETRIANIRNILDNYDAQKWF